MGALRHVILDRLMAALARAVAADRLANANKEEEETMGTNPLNLGDNSRTRPSIRPSPGLLTLVRIVSNVDQARIGYF
jgi:hypothetical protein